MTSLSSQAAVGALVGANIAACVIPAAWPCVASMYMNQGDPEALINAGLKWLKIYDELGKAQEEVNNTNLPRSEWQGRDRDAYDKRIDDYRSQITGSKQLALTMGTSLVLIGTLLIFVIAAMVVISAILLACMTYVIAAMAGLFTAPAAFAQASAIAVQCNNYMYSLTRMATLTAFGCAGAVAVAMGVDIGTQEKFGNDALSANLGASFRDAADNMIWGTLAKLEQMAMGAGMRHNAPKVDPDGKVPDSWVWRNSQHGGNNISRGFGGLGGLEAAGGGNLTETLRKFFPDYNKRDKGLYTNPPQ